MNYRDYAVHTFLVLLIELGLFAVTMQFSALYYSSSQPFPGSYRVTWSNIMDSSGFTFIIV